MIADYTISLNSVDGELYIPPIHQGFPLVPLKSGLLATATVKDYRSAIAAIHAGFAGGSTVFR